MATNALVVKPQKITFYSWDFPYIIYCYLFIGATLANARIDFQVGWKSYSEQIFGVGQFSLG